MVRAIPLGCPGLIGICRSIFLRYSLLSLTCWFRFSGSTQYVINTMLGHYAQRESFGARKQRLAALGSGSQTRKLSCPVCVCFSFRYLRYLVITVKSKLGVIYVCFQIGKFLRCKFIQHH